MKANFLNQIIGPSASFLPIFEEDRIDLDDFLTFAQLQIPTGESIEGGSQSEGTEPEPLQIESLGAYLPPLALNANTELVGPVTQAVTSILELPQVLQPLAPYNSPLISFEREIDGTPEELFNTPLEDPSPFNNQNSILAENQEAANLPPLLQVEVVDLLSDNAQSVSDPQGNIGTFTLAVEQEVNVFFGNEGAGFQNSLGWYTIGSDGEIQNVDFVFPNSSRTGSGGDLTPGLPGPDVLDGSSVSLGTLPAGTQIGFFLIPDGNRFNNYQNLDLDSGQLRFLTGDDTSDVATIFDSAPRLWFFPDVQDSPPVQIRSRYGNENDGYSYFHSAASDFDQTLALNSDNIEHVFTDINSDGYIQFGFEDLLGGGDRDFDDVIFFTDIGTQNTQALFQVADITVTDPETDLLASATITLDGLSGDTLSVDEESLQGNFGLTVIGNNTSSLTLVGPATVDDFSIILDTFIEPTENSVSLNLSETPQGEATPGARNLEYSVTDVFGNVSEINPVTIDIA